MVAAHALSVPPNVPNKWENVDIITFLFSVIMSHHQF